MIRICLDVLQTRERGVGAGRKAAQTLKCPEDRAKGLGVIPRAHRSSLREGWRQRGLVLRAPGDAGVGGLEVGVVEAEFSKREIA